MRIPIAWALHYPRRVEVGAARLSPGEGLSLEFGAVDDGVFPAIAMAREAGGRGDASTCALNAANEVAVQAFLSGSLDFLGIIDVVEEVLGAVKRNGIETYEDAIAVDDAARVKAVEVCRCRKS